MSTPGSLPRSIKTMHPITRIAAAILIIAALLYVFSTSPSFSTISAGVAIFLFGMRFMEEGFHAFTGGLLEDLLKRFTKGRLRSLTFGVISTSLMQSSSLVSIITISFLSAGLIDLAAGIGIIFGANLGTTTGAWLIAAYGLKVKIATYAMPMLAMGIVLVLLPAKQLKGLGNVLAGLGFIFLGIAFMKDGFDAFSQGFNFAQPHTEGFQAIFLFLLLGTAATVIMQSSHATLVLILTALAANQIDTEGAIVLSIGANIGTTITAMIGALSANIQGKRLAAAHLFFNIVTGTIVLTFIGPTLWGVETLSTNFGFTSEEATLKLALFHTLFNGLGVLLLGPFIPKIIPYLERLLPTPQAIGLKPLYLTEATEAFPGSLHEAVKLELIRLYDNALEIMAHGIHLHRRVLFSDEPLATAIKHNNELITIDLDTLYAQRVVSLSSAVLGAIARHDGHEDEDIKELNNYQTACFSIITCVKETKHLRPNLTKYIQHENKYIRKEYNTLRTNIGEAIRVIERIRREPETLSDTLELDTLRVQFTQDDISTSGTLEQLIRLGHITPQMGMSLMNDLRYTQTIIWALSDIGRTLFGDTNINKADAEQLLGLSDEEITDLARGLK